MGFVSVGRSFKEQPRVNVPAKSHCRVAQFVRSLTQSARPKARALACRCGAAHKRAVPAIYRRDMTEFAACVSRIRVVNLQLIPITRMEDL